MERLVDRLKDDSGGYLQYTVVDLTGLTGAYDFTLTPTLPLSLPDVDSGEAGYALFEAIERRPGLKLSAEARHARVLCRPHRPPAHGELTRHC